ncbi:MAG: hypothetical protein IJX36_03480 [Thermoguttaceae bacterium]|nr:hypothetical protein [Thermoguttaceae bacterium]MBQ9126734.1 hypothetical protein [Thermoguttaceae bacterium]
MKTTLQQVANVYSGVAGGRRVLVALFEYVKPDGTALAAEEIETILDAANAAASELGAEICWRASNGEIATPTLEADERVALELVANAVKLSPDPIPEVDESELASLEEEAETPVDEAAEIQETSSETPTPSADAPETAAA